MRLVLLLIVILLIVGALPAWPYSQTWGPYPAGGLGGHSSHHPHPGTVGVRVTDFSDFKKQIAEWANRQDWSDDLVTSYVRSAEEKLNVELLIRDMMKTAIDTVDHACANLPDDWIKADFMLIQNTGAPQGWIPIRYQPRDEFFRVSNIPASGDPPNTRFQSTFGRYTIEGGTIYFGGPIDATNGTSFRMHYYAQVPVFLRYGTELGLHQISVIVPKCRANVGRSARDR